MQEWRQLSTPCVNPRQGSVAYSQADKKNSATKLLYRNRLAQSKGVCALCKVSSYAFHKSSPERKQYLLISCVLLFWYFPGFCILRICIRTLIQRLEIKNEEEKDFFGNVFHINTTIKASSRLQKQRPEILPVLNFFSCKHNKKSKREIFTRFAHRTIKRTIDLLKGAQV